MLLLTYGRINKNMHKLRKKKTNHNVYIKLEDISKIKSKDEIIDETESSENLFTDDDLILFDEIDI